MKYGFLFDLDGVLVDTAKYHYLAWKELADELGIPFNERDNERLKGVSRLASLEIILELGNLKMTNEEKEALCAKKNKRYVEYISKLSTDEILPGTKDFLEQARAADIGIALGSASKNSPLILERLGIERLFDVVVDGTVVSKAKPDPEVFLAGAKGLGLAPSCCVVFEDSEAGIKAAHNGGLYAVGVGSSETLSEADMIISGFINVSVDKVLCELGLK